MATGLILGLMSSYGKRFFRVKSRHPYLGPPVNWQVLELVLACTSYDQEPLGDKIIVESIGGYLLVFCLRSLEWQVLTIIVI